MDVIEKDVVVIGSGPGGYAAAFYLADHGRDVTLIEKETVGGVCLNTGCIPSKALLNIANMIDKSIAYRKKGIVFSKPSIDLNQIRDWKDSVIKKLRGGIESLAAARNVTVIHGRAVFNTNQELRVETSDGQQYITFKELIIATGSRPFIPPSMDLGNPRIITSTEALDIDDIPNDLLVIGGGYIGMELGSVYASLGSSVTVVEATKEILSGADSDIINVFQKYVDKKMKAIHVNHKVMHMATKGKQICVTIQNDAGEIIDSLFDKVLISVGRKPNAHDLGIENTDIKRADDGTIVINDMCQTNVKNIYAIGDVSGGIQLAHKATREAKIAASAIVKETALNLSELVIPAVVFTDPEIAWVGITEKEAKTANQAVTVTKFPWSASGRALTLDRTEGFTKIISDTQTGLILGVGIVGEHAGDLIGEATLAIQSGLTIDDIAETIHPHPTLSESLMEAAEHALGFCTHLVKK